MNESRRTWVSLLALNGVWGLLRPRALMHSWNKRDGRDVLHSTCVLLLGRKVVVIHNIIHFWLEIALWKNLQSQNQIYCHFFDYTPWGPAGFCWSQLPPVESVGRHSRYLPPSHSLPSRWGRTCHASYPSSEEWSGKRRGYATSGHSLKFALMF